jgi:hypothetical protein
MPPPIALTTEQVEASQAWVRDFFKVFESFDREQWRTKFFRPDTIINVRNDPPLKYDEILPHFEKEQSLLTSLKHNLKHIDVLSDRIYVQADCISVVKNDPEQKETTMKMVCLFWKNINEDKLLSIDAYFDPSPLLERIKLVS